MEPMSDKELAWRQSVIENSFGKIMMKHLDDQLDGIMKQQAEEDADLWDN